MGKKSKIRMKNISLISRLINEKNYDQALEICLRPEYKNDGKIQSKLISILVIKEKYNEALEICNSEEFIHNEFIQLQKVKLLCKQEKYDEALEICNRDEYKNSKYFASQKKIIKSLKNSALELNTYELTEKAKILTRIYANVEKLFEIKNSNVDYFDKQILIIAFYEKHNRSVGVKIIKELKKQIEDVQKIKILNNLLTKLNAKKNTFDIGVYERLLNVKVSFTYLEELTENKKNEEMKEYVIEERKTVPLKNIINTFNTQLTKKDEKIKETREEKNFVGQIGQFTNNRYNTVKAKNEPKKEIKKEKEEKQTVKKTDNIILKEVFEPQIEEVQKYLYIKMQSTDLKTTRNAIKAWDIFDNMINKSINDRENLERFLHLLKKIACSEELEIEMNDSYIKKVERRYY